MESSPRYVGAQVVVLTVGVLAMRGHCIDEGRGVGALKKETGTGTM
jgi:hypothetical protein